MASSAGHIRPGRYLWVFALIVVILYALVFGTGDHKASPELGIDLKGGTTVTLTARTTNGAPPDQTSLNEALQVIEARVNGTGVSGAQVNLSGSNIIITVPGNQGTLAKSLGETAHLMFRPVVQQVAATQTSTPATTTPPPTSGAPTPSGTATPTSGAPSGSSTASPPPSSTGTAKPPATSGGTSPQAYVGPGAKAATPTSTPPTPSTTPSAPPSSTKPGGSGNINTQEAQAIAAAKATRQSTNTTVQQAALNALKCGQGVQDPLIGNDDPTKPLVTCDANGQVKYVLGPRLIDGSAITSATSGQNPNGVDFVVNLTFNGSASKTWADYTAAHVNDSVAVVLDTSVVSAETIQSAIPGGNTQITGNFTQQSAAQLAQQLQFGSLPLSFETSNA
ncbi:MAG TPA: protein translocase subunit SecD, partial [Pseudonocardiaceae bacterium]|nr:protein translocase subunit SecD [Pseudonocardiaceae bacterium]